MSNIELLCIVFSALLAGTVDAIAGGGGLITIPSLMIAGLPPQAVLGTNKLAMSAGTGVATYKFWRNGKINWKIVGGGIGFTLIGSALGSRLAVILPAHIVAKVMIALLPLGLLSVVLKKPHTNQCRELTSHDLWVKVPLICGLLGMYDGFFGPGTGTFIVMAFHMLLHRDLVESTANAKMFNLTSNVSALVVFALHGSVLLGVGLPMAAATMTGNYIGSHLALTRGQTLIRTVLFGVLVMLMATLVIKFLVIQ
ncbi:hypothetical protein EB093_07310 [bacterium]|nr:hypothetical protein [bacterium]